MSEKIWTFETINVQIARKVGIVHLLELLSWKFFPFSTFQRFLRLRFEISSDKQI